MGNIYRLFGLCHLIAKKHNFYKILIKEVIPYMEEK